MHIGQPTFFYQYNNFLALTKPRYLYIVLILGRSYIFDPIVNEAAFSMAPWTSVRAAGNVLRARGSLQGFLSSFSENSWIPTLLKGSITPIERKCVLASNEQAIFSEIQHPGSFHTDYRVLDRQETPNSACRRASHGVSRFSRTSLLYMQRTLLIHFLFYYSSKYCTFETGSKSMTLQQTMTWGGGV